MSAPSKTGPCRIPTFGSRIPQQSKDKITEISNKQIGRRVRVGEKEGILRFIGSVHFSKGVWCGIELNSAVGKNDGIVHGVRYFACADRHGLMAPQSKVLLVEGSCESLNDDVSGPYSMLFIEPKFRRNSFINKSNVGNISKQHNVSVNLDRTVSVSREKFAEHKNNKTVNETFNVNQKIYSNHTYNGGSSDTPEQKFIKKQENEIYNTQQQRAFNLNFTKVPNETIIKGASSDFSFEEKKISDKINSKHNEISSTDREKACTIKTSEIVNFSINNSNLNVENSKKRTNKGCEVSLGCGNSSIKVCNSLSPTIEKKIFNTVENRTEKTCTYLQANKSYENLLTDSNVEIKRRRTSNPKNQNIDELILKNLPESIDKPSSLPQLRSSLNFSSPPLTSLALNKFSTSTPCRGEYTGAFLRKLRISEIGVCTSDKNINYDDNSSKRDSLEFEESLGILTPDHMSDGMMFTNMQTRSPSLECESNISEFSNKNQESSKKSDLPSPRDTSLGILDEKIINVSMHNSKELILDVIEGSEIQSPNLNSMTDFSLGIIDEQVISNLKTDITMNMELPLGPIDETNDFTLVRLEQTPSPEELPLDPTPIIESDPKPEPSKTKTANSFITSITSITSLDTGYQGDGEMSRPASRGADNSPLTRRPLPRAQSRRPDPMTDSDFYTESDVDNHEDNQLRGDRRAQVIDGTLYGVDPQAAADIYVNNRENMDSSGIFTDLETNTRNEDTPNEVPDVSPSDTSSKTVSENSQNNVHEVLEKISSKNDKKDTEISPQKDNPKKRNAPSPGILSPSSISSPRHGSKDETSAKKYKLPKRDMVPTVKSKLEQNQVQQNDKKKKEVIKPVGRWDAVMNKISKNQQGKTNLKEVKSRVFNNLNVNTVNAQRPNEIRKQSTRPVGTQKNLVSKSFVISKTEPDGIKKPSSDKNYLSADFMIPTKRSPTIRIKTTPNKKPEAKQKTPVSENRRLRNRTSASSTPKNGGSNVESSIHSSLSDLSAATIPLKETPGSAKKQRDVVQVTQVLTANNLSPRNVQQQTAAENKKNATLHPSSSNESKARRAIFSSKEKKQTTNKECGRGTVKGGRTSPSVRPPTQTRAPAKQQVPRVAEALAVLVQHLVFNVDAFQVPTLRRQVEKFRLEAEEIRLSCQQLEETLADEKIKQARAIEDERKRCRSDITELIEKHRNQLAQLNNHHTEIEQSLRAENEAVQQNLCKQHEEQLVTLKKEFEKLQRTHEESLDILREENESIREQIDEKRLEVEKATHEKLEKEYESKEAILKEQNQKLTQQLANEKTSFEETLRGLIEENKKLREENDRLLSYGDDKGIGIQEVQSLRAVLELKQKEVGELRKALAEASQKAEVLVGAEEKARLLNARCEDLQLQLQRKAEYEQSLIQEKAKLEENFKEETIQKRRLSQYNEELQWKLKQNKEVISKVLEQAEETVFNRSVLSSSFNERHSTSRLNLERTLSFRERTYSNKSNVDLEDSIRPRKSKNVLEFEIEDLSPPSSPKVKGVVEKSDSVSYVLDLDESPDVVASRIVRRSFRNSTPPKNTPTKSPSSKRPRIRTPLSQSASSSAIVTTNTNEIDRPRSASVRNGECDNDVFLWASNVTTTHKMYREKLNELCEPSHSVVKLDDNLDLDEDHEVDIQLPALPSELGRRNGAQALPSPKHLAGEAMISESNSEDESTSSSQL